MGFLRALKDFFTGLFSRDPAEIHRRRELKRIHKFLASRRPLFFRPSHKAVLPGFAGLLLSYSQLLRSVSDIVRRTIGSTDLRQAQKYFDFLIDTRLPEEQREKKAFFSYDGMRQRVEASMDPDEELEVIAREFQSFMRVLESPQVRSFDVELVDMERVVDICRHDNERLLGLFDPGVDVQDPRYKPDFAAAKGDAVLPELIDFYYVTSGFGFTPRMEENIAVLLDRLAPPDSDTADQKAKLSKVLSALNRLLTRELGQDVLLALIRAIKGEPAYMPDVARSRTSFLESYRNRFFTQFQRDKDRIGRERHEAAITQDISALFPDAAILELEGYTEENSAILSRDSPESFTYVKPMRILKTFVTTVFEGGFKDPLKKFLVEGYFESKNFQNNLANVFFQCEHSSERFAAFEDQLSGNGRVSVVAMKRYLEELRRGKDIQDFLSKLVDGVNARARDIIENETNLFNMLADSINEIVADFKRPTPELVTNIRTIGSAKNKELIAIVSSGWAKILRLVKIMRNFTLVRAAESAHGPAETAAWGADAELSGGLSDLEEV
jgi:hypothetical protein